MLHFLCSFDKGPRAARGGLTGGWSAHSDGKILKIWGVRNNTHNLNHVYVKFPIEGRMVVNTMYVRMYLKIIRGKAAVQVSRVVDAWASVVHMHSTYECFVLYYQIGLSRPADSVASTWFTHHNRIYFLYIACHV